MAALCATLFWLALLFVLYTYALYPIAVALWARLMPWPVARAAGHQPTITIVVAAYNDATKLPGRIANLFAQVYPAELFDIIAANDGSSDATADVLRQLIAQHAPRLRAVNLPQNMGKAVALNAALELAQGELIVFADARQRFEPQVLARLAENFADPQVGCASGELMFTEGDLEQAAAAAAQTAGLTAPVSANVGLYWKYEKWIRRSEAALDSMLGATGAIYAIRRVLYEPLPEGTLLDDFLTPMRIALKGSRAIFDARARAWDQPSQAASQEFTRKVRTLAGNYQAFALEPGLLRPWVNQTTCFQLWSHKVFRLWVPFALLLVLLATLLRLLFAPGWFFAVALLAQLGFYGAAWLGWRCEAAGKKQPHKFVSLAYTFTVLNLAAAIGLKAWLRARDHRGLWQKAYAEPGPGEPDR